MINLFRIISWLEGISYILLLFIATPIKYISNDPTYVKLLGQLHGILFILYIILAYILKGRLKWSNKTFGKVCILSILPLGTFFVGQYLKK